MGKSQNLRTPILEAVRTLNRYGMEVAAGMITGLDTDTSETPQAIIDFARESQIPIITANIVYALPNTPLYERLKKDGRILSEEESAQRDSNIRFLAPYEQVVGDWLKVVEGIYHPEVLYGRYSYNAANTYPHRLSPRRPWRQATVPNLLRAFRLLGRILWNVGWRSDYRRLFWGMAFRQLRQAKVETMFQVAMVAHHLITYARECVAGKLKGSHFTDTAVKSRSSSPPECAAVPSAYRAIRQNEN
jgi:radical SAM superfamily enzyme YgiQ (UPF0313 family)